jgi:hypothetical protein
MNTRIVLISVLSLMLTCFNLNAQVKLGQTGFQFLSVGVDARGTAMGDAFTTIEGTSAALFYNPAGIARMNSLFDLTVSQHEWIADIQYLSGSLALNFAQGRYGVIGLTYLVLDYGEFLGTRVADNEQGFIDTGTFSPTATAIGLGYAIELSEHFSIGGQIKYAYQSLGSSIVRANLEDPFDMTPMEKDYAIGVMVFDFGTRYATGYRSLVFGMSVRNFSKEVQYELESFQLPLTFKFGLSMNVFDFFHNVSDIHKLYVSVDAAHPRSGPEYLNIGGEYTFQELIAVRAGYITNTINDQSGLTAGIGIQKFGVGLDYAYTPYTLFPDIHRISLRVSF